MRDTGCHIHFPDSNKCLANPVAMPQQAKNDQVSISGCAKDVEKAREMLRVRSSFIIIAIYIIKGGN
jgi:hypothetical protein